MSTPVADGLFAETDDGARLIGSACQACGATFFPSTATCRDPRCSGTRTEPVALGPDGEVISCTVLHYPPPPQFSPPGGVTPYAVALVDVGGVHVAGLVRGDPESVRIGDRVQLVVDTVRMDSSGAPVVTWMFAPQQGGRS